MNRIIRNATIIASIALVARHFLQISRVSGNSMFPELHDKDTLLVDKTAYGHAHPQTGDVVVFDAPGTDHMLIKRIIGVPGDHIVIRDGTLWINGVVGNDDYTADGATDGNVDLIVPEGRYFVLGDNRLHSKDSRAAMVGCIPESSILGKVSIRLYPPGRVFVRDVIAKEEPAEDEHVDESAEIGVEAATEAAELGIDAASTVEQE